MAIEPLSDEPLSDEPLSGQAIAEMIVKTRYRDTRSGLMQKQSKQNTHMAKSNKPVTRR